MRPARLTIRTPKSITYKMPCYAIAPAHRRNIHIHPIFGPQAISFSPRYSAPFFRGLEEDFAQFYSFFKEVDQSLSAAKKSFQPRFDIKEESDKFILHGELPGVQPEHLQVEFVDQNTLVVKGKVVRQESHGTPPAETAQEEPKDVTMDGALSDAHSESSTNYHKASVEDENDNAAETTSTTPAAEDQITKAPTQEAAKKSETPQPHYWVSERTVGEFQRAFRFPGKVNQDQVKAALKDGILTVSVPKLAAQDHRRKIAIQGE